MAPSVNHTALQGAASHLWQRHWPNEGSLDATVAISTRLIDRAGYYEPARRRIVLSHAYHEHYGTEELMGTLLHELVHHYLQRTFGERVRPHGPEFRSEMVRVGCPRHCRDTGRLKKLRFVCPSCSREFRRVRKPPRGGIACGPCCKRYANGRFDRRFRLMHRD